MFLSLKPRKKSEQLRGLVIHCYIFRSDLDNFDEDSVTEGSWMPWSNFHLLWTVPPNFEARRLWFAYTTNLISPNFNSREKKHVIIV